MKQNLLPKFAAVMISSLLSTNVFAGPDQLDVLGLIPGVSESHQVNQTRSGQLFEIGGHKMACGATFIDDKLASFGCLTGKSSDRRYPTWTKVDNIEVHLDLKKGFTKKFGKPDSVTRIPVRTRNGVEYIKEEVIWKDRRGNVLNLYSMTDSIDEGMISLISSADLKRSETEISVEEAKKKF